jgi:hypothetical protein
MFTDDDRELAATSTSMVGSSVPAGTGTDRVGDFQSTLAAGRLWLADIHRLLSSIMIRRDPTADEVAFLERLTDARHFIHLIPRSAPELAEPIAPRRIPHVEELGLLARRQLRERSADTEMFYGATGHIRLRHKVAYLDGGQDRHAQSRGAETDPLLVIVAIADLPLVRSEPRLASCLVCYDDMIIEASKLGTRRDIARSIR